jgi:hypothetical protein
MLGEWPKILDVRNGDGFFSVGFQEAKVAEAVLGLAFKAIFHLQSGRDDTGAAGMDGVSMPF